MMRQPKHVSDSKTEQIQILMPEHINGAGRLFGGQLVEWIDVVAGVVARRHSGCNITTAAIDNLQFKAGAYANDTLVLIGRITHVGRTSMEVRVDTYVEDLGGFRWNVQSGHRVSAGMNCASSAVWRATKTNLTCVAYNYCVKKRVVKDNPFLLRLFVF